MSFDPFDPTTWREDPDDFVVPKHELESTITIAEADAEEQAQGKSFLGMYDELQQRYQGVEAASTHVPEFGGPAFKEGVQDEALRQLRRGLESLDNAVQAVQEAEEVLSTEDVIKAVQERDPVLAQIEELKAQLRRIEKSRWHWPWSKKEA